MLTYFTANQVLNLITGRIQQIGFGTIHVGLSYTEPARDGTNVTEPNSSTGYERVILGNYQQSLTQLMSQSTVGETQNVKNIFFPEAIEAYPNPVTHFLIYSGNNLVAFGELETPIQPIINSVPLVRLNGLKITAE